LFRQWQPDVVHTHSSKAGIVARLAARIAKVPIIIHTIHGMSFNRTQPWVLRTAYRLLERFCARFTDRIVCVADAMISQSVTASVGPLEKFATVYSGMRTEWFSPDRFDRAAVRKSWSIDDDAIVVGTVARLFTGKGYEQLIPAMAKAAAANDKIRFVWVGDGAQRGDYEKQLTELGIRDRVYLAGLVRPEEVAAMLAGVDVLVHASQWEGLPRSLVQALLMEKPVVSFDIDGAPEVVIPGRTGLLVKLNDIDALARAIIYLVGHPEKRRKMGIAGRQLCLKRFDHRVMTDQLERLYRQLRAERCPT